MSLSVSGLSVYNSARRVWQTVHSFDVVQHEIIVSQYSFRTWSFQKLVNSKTQWRYMSQERDLLEERKNCISNTKKRLLETVKYKTKLYDSQKSTNVELCCMYFEACI